MEPVRRQRDWLIDFGRAVLMRLRSKLAVPSIALTTPSRIHALISEADGWYVEVGHVRPERGSGLQIWLDRWPRTPSRKLWFGYKGTRQEQVVTAAAIGTTEFGPAYRLYDGAFAFDPEQKAELLR